MSADKEPTTFGASPLDNEDIRPADPAVAEIDAMPDGEAETVYQNMLQAAKEKYEASGAKAALKAVADAVRPFIPLGK